MSGDDGKGQNLRFDILSIIGIPLMLIPIVLWYLVSVKQFDFLKRASVRVQVLSTRTVIIHILYLSYLI